jgi:hypothetical protein
MYEGAWVLDNGALRDMQTYSQGRGLWPCASSEKAVRKAVRIVG